MVENLGSVAPEKTDSLAAVITELGSVVAFSRKIWARQIAAHYPELGIADAIILHIIQNTAEMTVTSLSQRLETDKADVSRRIANLKRSGYVTTCASPADGRVQLLSLTPAGQLSTKAVRGGIAEAYRDRLADWSASDLTKFAELLYRFNSDAHN